MSSTLHVDIVVGGAPPSGMIGTAGLIISNRIEWIVGGDFWHRSSNFFISSARQLILVLQSSMPVVNMVSEVPSVTIFSERGRLGVARSGRKAVQGLVGSGVRPRWLLWALVAASTRAGRGGGGTG